ncbi:protein FAR-RED ELONGATED HYPOCOTYL 3-like [Camellia sinensis]|uniref:protein FAR-RED ELONGATED HYPOCOTYL 3-like n=1 Tax=Camellia sinensis TaxID=4442 RepID=UPI00103597CF|nr:protein FAR-RED ELONGATED HYPOCOTYL 3-like [Camellia sinensis]
MGKKDKNVTMDKDGSFSCSCRKFEVKDILCRHCVKVLRDIFNATELPPQYILKRWTKKARADSVKDRRGYEVKADVKLHQSDRYRSLMTMFRAIASRATKTEKTYHLSVLKGEVLSVMVEDKLSVHICGQVESDEIDCPIQAKGLKKRESTSKGRRRIKGGMEKSIAKKKRMQSSQGTAVYTSQGHSQSRFIMGSNSIQDHGHGAYICQSQPQAQVVMGDTCGPPLMYGK